MKRIIVVGFGYTGLNLVGKLDRKQYEVVVIEPKDHFFHHIGMLRAAVEPSWYDQLKIPLPKLSTPSRFVQDTVRGVSDGGVELSNGDSLEGDIIVMATGSRHAKLTPDGVEGREAFEVLSQRIKEARSILFVGAGAVGLELAGEIRHIHPQVDITMVDRSKSLFKRFVNPRFGRALQKQLDTLNIKLILGTGVDRLPRSGEPFSGKIGDEEMVFDLAFSSIGARPNTESYAESLGEAVTERGQIKVDTHFRVEGKTSLFAIGDITDIDEPKTTVSGNNHAPVVVKNIPAVLEGRSLSATYATSSLTAMMIPLGPRVGSTHLPFFGGITMGSLMTRMKGSDLFLGQFTKQVKAV